MWEYIRRQNYVEFLYHVVTVSYVFNTYAAHLSLPLAPSLPPSAAEPDPQPKSNENEPTVIPLYEVSSF